MSEFHAALGLATLDMAEEHINRRHEIYTLYKKHLSQLPGVRFPSDTNGGTTNGIYFSIIIDESVFGLTRDQLHEALKYDHVDSRRYYTPPLHRQKANLKYASLYTGKLPNTELISNSSLTLPVFSHMTDHQVNGVCEAITRINKNCAAVSDKLLNE
jgi:dTDP-4-amino-4,6-dideoxygalactose transaminase